MGGNQRGYRGKISERFNSSWRCLMGQALATSVYECPHCRLNLILHRSRKRGLVWRFSEEIVNLIDNDSLVLPEHVVACLQDVNSEFLRYLSKNPHRIHSTTPRQFEKIVAEILKASGFEVELTPASKDGGFDVLAVSKSEVGSFLTLVECKKYSNPVPIDVIRSIYGLKQHHGASSALIATTSRFTKPAIKFQQVHKYELALKDFDDIAEWLRNWRKNQK